MSKVCQILTVPYVFFHHFYYLEHGYFQHETCSLYWCFVVASGEGDHSPVSEGTPTYEPQHLPPWESGAGGGGILNLPGGGHADHERAAGNAGKHSPRSDCSVRSRSVQIRVSVHRWLHNKGSNSTPQNLLNLFPGQLIYKNILISKNNVEHECSGN